MDYVLESIAYGLMLTLLATWRALPILAIVLIVDLIMRRSIAAKYQVLLWSLVALRMLMPVSISSPWSIHSSVDRLAGYATTVSVEKPRVLHVESADHPESDAIETLPFDPNLTETIQSTRNTAATIDWEFYIAVSLIIVWSSVACVSLLRGIVANWRFARRLACCNRVEDTALQELLESESESLRIAKSPAMKFVPELTSPSLFGIFKSTLCLPISIQSDLSQEELRWVLRHELAHLARRDAWLLTMTSIVKSMHWFDPFARFTVGRIQARVEQAADELALRDSTPSQAVAYGRMLLRFAEQATSSKSSPAIGLIQFANLRGLRGRIQRLTGKRVSTSLAIRYLIALSIIGLAIVGLTDAASESELNHDQTGNDSLSSLAPLQNIHEPEEAQLMTESYNVGPLLAKLRSIDTVNDPVTYLLGHAMLGPKSNCRMDGDRLIAEATPERHRSYAKMLKAWADQGPCQIVLETRFYEADESLASGFDWLHSKVELRKQEPGTRPALATISDEVQLRRFVNACQREPRASVLMAPKITAFNGQFVNMTNGVDRPFVTDLKANQDGLMVPKIEVIHDGWETRMQMESVGNGSIELDIDLKFSKIGDVGVARYPFKTPVEGSGMTFQVPNVSVTRVRTTVQLKEGENLILGFPGVNAKNGKQESAPMFVSFAARLLKETILTELESTTTE